MVGRFDGLEGGPDDGRWQTMISRDARGTHGDDRGTNLVRQAERSRLERQKRESKRGTSTRVGSLAAIYNLRKKQKAVAVSKALQGPLASASTNIDPSLISSHFFETVCQFYQHVFNTVCGDHDST